MSPDGFAAFMDVLAGPAAPVPEMVEMARPPAPWGGWLRSKAVMLWFCQLRSRFQPGATYLVSHAASLRLTTG